MGQDALLEMLTDLFAAQRAYDKQWPQSGKWPWIERKFANVLGKMHPVSAAFITALLVKFGFEEAVMKSLGKEKFDWEEAFNLIKDQEPSWLHQFQTLYKFQLKN